MPKYWYDRASSRALDSLPNGNKKGKEFNLKILADKKPYFMRYIYPQLMKDYNTYIKKTDAKCIREFRKTISEISSMGTSERTKAENIFVEFYNARMPIGMHECVMNRICRKIEAEFDGRLVTSLSQDDFDYSILKSGHTYTPYQYRVVLELYKQYQRRTAEYKILTKNARIDEYASMLARHMLAEEFKTECLKKCSEASKLCDIILDICYTTDNSKQFCWDVCGEEIVNNLLNANNNKIYFPSEDDDGDIEFCGKKFSLSTTEVEVL